MENMLGTVINDEIKKSPNAVMFDFAIFIIMSISYLILLLKYSWNKYTIVILIFLIVLFVLIILMQFGNWYSENKLPKCKKNKKGVLVVLDADNADNFKIINRIFNNTFNNWMQKENDIIQIIIPKYDKIHNNADILNNYEYMLKKTRSDLYILVTQNHIDNSYTLKIQLFGFKDVVRKLSKDYNFKFDRNNALDLIEIKAEGLALYCKYLMGLLYVKYDDFNKAITIFDNLYNELTLTGTSVNKGKFLTAVKEMALLLHTYNAYNEIEKCYLKKEKYNCLNIENEIKLAEKYDNYSLELLDIKIHLAFLKYRNVNVCNQIYENYKKVNPNIVNTFTYKINTAFFKTMNNKSETEIVKYFISIFEEFSNTCESYNTDLNEIISFYEDDLMDREKRNNKVYLALALLYLEVGNTKLFYENLTLYYKEIGKNFLYKKNKIILRKRYKITL